MGCPVLQSTQEVGASPIAEKSLDIPGVSLVQRRGSAGGLFHDQTGWSAPGQHWAAQNGHHSAPTYSTSGRPLLVRGKGREAAGKTGTAKRRGPAGGEREGEGGYGMYPSMCPLED